MCVWAGSLPSLPLLRNGFQAWNVHLGTGKSTTNLLERWLEKQDLVKRLISVSGWVAVLGVQHAQLALTHTSAAQLPREASQGKLWWRNGQQLAVPGPGSTGWVPGAHPQLWAVLEPLPSLLVSPNRNHSHLLGKPHLWVIEKPQAVLAQHPEVFALSVEVAVWNSQQHTEGDSEGFSELAPLTYSCHFLKGRLLWVHPGLLPRQGAGLPQASSNNPGAEGPGSPLSSAPPSLAADCWSICQRVFWLLPQGCCVQLFVLFLFDFAKFCFSLPSVQDGAWNSELLARLGH